MSSLFVHTRWFVALAIIAISFVVAFFVPIMWVVSLGGLILFAVLSILDIILLFSGKKSITVERYTAERWHLGEDNEVALHIDNQFGYFINIEVIDELPILFQIRDFVLNYKLKTNQKIIKNYNLKPLQRGIYHFGNINIFVKNNISFFKRRIIVKQATAVKVYPTTKLMRAYQLMAISDRNNLIGAKKVRRLGHSLEFEQIKEYVIGDDIRTINWKATARKGEMMVNTYTDIRSQQIYSLIDKGRSMKMPFEGMTLMDYAIKSALIFSNIALYKHDKAGLITFSSQVNDIIPADQGAKQAHKILETLYNQKTDFLDSDLEKLYSSIHQKLSQRSFLMLYTNFESLPSLERQMPFLRSIAQRHMLCVVFFENTAIKEIVNTQPNTIEGIYTQTIAERFDFDKKQIVKELRRYGIMAILTTPEKLNVDVINNYLELKARQLL